MAHKGPLPHIHRLPLPPPGPRQRPPGSLVTSSPGAFRGEARSVHRRHQQGPELPQKGSEPGVVLLEVDRGRSANWTSVEGPMGVRRCPSRGGGEGRRGEAAHSDAPPPAEKRTRSRLSWQRSHEQVGEFRLYIAGARARISPPLVPLWGFARPHLAAQQLMTVKTNDSERYSSSSTRRKGLSLESTVPSWASDHYRHTWDQCRQQGP